MVGVVRGLADPLAGAGFWMRLVGADTGLRAWVWLDAVDLVAPLPDADNGFGFLGETRRRFGWAGAMRAIVSRSSYATVSRVLSVTQDQELNKDEPTLLQRLTGDGYSASHNSMRNRSENAKIQSLRWLQSSILTS